MEQGGGEGQVAIQLLPKVSEYLSLIMSLVFAFGLVFQLPVITTLLARVGFVHRPGPRREAQIRDRDRLRGRSGSDAAGSGFPDRLALPAILLYEISIYTARLVERRRAAEALEREAASEQESSSETADPAKG